MEVTVKINGLDKLNTLLDKAQEQGSKLRRTIAEINRVAQELVVEVNQPTAGTDG